MLMVTGGGGWRALRGAFIAVHAADDVNLCRLVAALKIASEDREIGEYLSSLLTV